MSKRVKDLIAGVLSSRFDGLKEAVIIDYSGLSGEESREFRAHLRGAGASMSVVKNSLVRRVFNDSGIEFDAAAFIGPMAVISGAEDAVTASKAVAEWAKKNGKKFRFKAGLLEGKLLDEAGAERLQKMPSAQDVRQMAVSAIAGPLTATVGVLSNTLCSLPLVVKAIADKQGEGA